MSKSANTLLDAVAQHTPAGVLLLPVAARRALAELPDDLWTKIKIEFYKDPMDAVFESPIE